MQSDSDEHGNGGGECVRFGSAQYVTGGVGALFGGFQRYPTETSHSMRIIFGVLQAFNSVKHHAKESCSLAGLRGSQIKVLHCWWPFGLTVHLGKCNFLYELAPSEQLVAPFQRPPDGGLDIRKTKLIPCLKGI